MPLAGGDEARLEDAVDADEELRGVLGLVERVEKRGVLD
jgi:hypothetical protein